MTDRTFPLKLTAGAEKRLKSIRRPMEGVKNILKFNWHFYVFSIVLAVALTFLLPFSPVVSGIVYLMVITWTWLSLLVSYLVYDVSSLYRYRWLLEELRSEPVNILNIHAGFDETSRALVTMFPSANLQVFDFFNAERNTEISIKRARADWLQRMAREGVPVEPISVDIAGWNLADDSQDLIVVFMAVHELRKASDRDIFFREMHRVLAPGGMVVVVEHLRDKWNFLAFGPGFLHFFPRSEWLRLAEKSDFVVSKERTIAGFVQVFYLCKQ